MEVNIGGDRLGSGAKMNTSLRNYERSTHDLSRVVRTTMAPGTLVPLMTEIGLPGDTFDIELETLIRTMPTLGPLFGSFKFQADVFMIPVRPYQAQLHMNLLNVGLDMSQVKLPMMANYVKSATSDTHGAYKQSSLLAYLGIRGGGYALNSAGVYTMYRNALPLLAYWDIYKQYYANKQESKAYYITPAVVGNYSIQLVGISAYEDDVDYDVNTSTGLIPDGPAEANNWYYINFVTTGDQPDQYVKFKGSFRGQYGIYEINQIGRVEIMSTQIVRVWNTDPDNNDLNVQIGEIVQHDVRAKTNEIKISNFDLTNIDDMRENLLHQSKGTPFLVDELTPAPYGSCVGRTNLLGNYKPNNEFSQNGLALKTYQSDIFNNWLKTEWIEGSGSIAAITSIDTSSGSFKLDTLNLAKKVYDMLNRIAVSGSSYQDWQAAVWGEETLRMSENPIYMGGMSREIVFEEIVSTADTYTTDAGSQPLGSLAGKGTQAQKKKGGNLVVKVNEPCLIMCIASITPRIDYSQGNKWFTRLETMNDFHKPALDGIGFQNLITEEMAHWDSTINTDTNITTYKSAGKQPAWMNYMTAVNEVYGDFAENDLMFMCLNRRYSSDFTNTPSIKDLTTYIDPVKYNYAFANTRLDAMNFWVQLAIDITARRKMSAKIIPNL